MSAIRRRHESDLHWILRNHARFISYVIVVVAVMLVLGGLPAVWLAGGVQP